MRLIYIKLLLLVSIVSVLSDGRPKRHFKYIRGLISSALFGEPKQVKDVTKSTNREPENQYQVYEIPGFEDVLLKAKITDAPVLSKKVEKQETLEMQPLESYIGTDNPENTLIALQNVKNLLATDIMNRENSNMVKDTITSMISSLNTVPQINRQPISKTVEVEAVNIPSNAMQGLFEPKLLQRQMERNYHLMTYPTSRRKIPKASLRHTISRTSSLPMCIQKRIDDLISLDTKHLFVPHLKSYSRKTERIRHPYAFFQLSSPVLHEPVKIELLQESIAETPIVEIPLDRPMLPFLHFEEDFNYPAANADFTQLNYGPNFDEVSPMIQNKVQESHILLPKPSEYITKINNGFSEISQLEDNNSKTTLHNFVKLEDHEKVTFPRYSYQQVHHDHSKEYSLTKEKDVLVSNENTESPFLSHRAYLPPLVDADKIIPKDENVIKENNNETKAKNGTTSRYRYKQANPNNANVFSLAKEKDELLTNVSLPLHHVTPSTSPLFTDNVTPGYTGEATSSKNIPSKETLSDYILEREKSDNHPFGFSILKEKDKLKTNVDRVVLLRNHTSHLSHVEKAAENATEKETLTHYIQEQLVHNNQSSIDTLKENKQLKTNHNVELPNSNHYFHTEPSIIRNVSTIVEVLIENKQLVNNNQSSMDSMKENKQFNADTELPVTSHYDQTEPSIIRTESTVVEDIVKNKEEIKSTVDDLNRSTLPNMSDQVTSSYLKEEIGQEAKTNVQTNSSLTTTTFSEFANINTVTPYFTNEDGLFTNKATATESIIETTISSLNDFEIQQAKHTRTFNKISNLVAVPHGNYLYHRNNIDGSSVMIRSNEDGVSVDTKSAKGRGDIPDEAI